MNSIELSSFLITFMALQLAGLVVLIWWSRDSLSKKLEKFEERTRKRIEANGYGKIGNQLTAPSDKKVPTVGKIEQARQVADRWTEALENGEVPEDLERLATKGRGPATSGILDDDAEFNDLLGGG
jgi:hypothetical protein